MLNTFKALSAYKIQNIFDINELENYITSQQFQPCLSQESESIGWGEVDGNPFVQVDGYIFLQVIIEQKILPSSVINQYAAIKAEEISESQGYKVGRKQMKDIKEDLIQELLPNALKVSKKYLVCFNTQDGLMFINNNTQGVNDKILGLMAKTFPEFPVAPIQTKDSPSGFMTKALQEPSTLPVNLHIENDFELRDAHDLDVAIKYKKYDPLMEDVVQHLQSGKQCTALAFSFDSEHTPNSSISFTLNDSMQLRQIKFNDFDTSLIEPEEQLVTTLFIEAKSLTEVVQTLVGIMEEQEEE